MSQDRKCITPVGILSYPHLFTPQDPMEEGGVAKFGAVLIFEDGTDITALRQAVAVAAQEKFGAKAKTLLKAGKLRLPFRDEWEEKGYPEDSIFINAKTTNPPGIVGRYADPDTGKAQRITDEEEVYPGMYAKFSVTAFGYDVKGNKGVAFALNNVQKWGEGERLDGRVKAEDEFEAEAPATADLGDLDGSNEEAPADDGGDDGDLTDLM
jgi:hypothetical protein